MADLPEEWRGYAELFCALIARVDYSGTLVDAPPGYIRAPEAGVALLHVFDVAPKLGQTPDQARPDQYLFAFLDVLGFETLLTRIGLKDLLRRYENPLEAAVAPNSGPLSRVFSIFQGQVAPGILRLPIRTAYFSDSLLLWIHYHPIYVAEFMNRCSRVFCEALALGLPLRGAVSVGTAVLDKDRGVYLGLPLVEAVRLESSSNWIGVVLGASCNSLRVPIHDGVLAHEAPLKEGGASLFSGLVLDWPRVWRETRQEPAEKYLRELCQPSLPSELQARYTAAITFCETSKAREADGMGGFEGGFEFDFYSQSNHDWFRDNNGNFVSDGPGSI